MRFFLKCFIILVLPIVTSANQDPKHLNKVSESKIYIGQLKVALDLYRKDCGDYPEVLQALLSNVENCLAWGPYPYLTKRVSSLKDFWGNDLGYKKYSTSKYNLMSFGADGKLNGFGDSADILADDI